MKQIRFVFKGLILVSILVLALQEHNIINYFVISPIPEAARWVCGRSLAGIAGSNPADGMDVCLL
jgi:hypothetical protein